MTRPRRGPGRVETTTQPQDAKGRERGDKDEDIGLRCVSSPRYVFFPFFIYFKCTLFILDTFWRVGHPLQLRMPGIGPKQPTQNHHHTLPRSKHESEGCSSLPLPTTPLPPPSLQMRDGGALLTAPMEGAWDVSQAFSGSNDTLFGPYVCFFLILLCDVLTTIFFIYLGIREVGVRSDNKMGPNDASRRVIWAISMFFLYFIFFVY